MVEHVIREEKLMAAYDLVQIYCELIAAHLPTIESQKNCPIDMKEAISSVIFASPRLPDIPELVDVRKQITHKYGKEFVSAAIELRPDCGLVDKLCAKAPDRPTKLKMLTSIAEEHNIKWEPNSFGENDGKSSQDLLVGPNKFVKVSYEDESGGNQSTTSGMFSPEIRPLGIGSQEKEFRYSNSGNGNSFFMARQNWNMEFKDAASAAQAAAESAEHASMAARAAAELSNYENMSRKYSSGSNSYSGRRFREVPEEYVVHDGKHLPTGSVNSTFHGRGSSMHNEPITAKEKDNLVGALNEYYRTSHESVVHAQSASLSSSSSAHGSQIADMYQKNNTFEHKNSDLHEHHLGDATLIRQSRKASSSHLIPPIDDHNQNFNSHGQKKGNNAVEPNSYNDICPVFDDSGSDDDYKFVSEHKYKGERSSLFSSPGSKSQVDPSETKSSWRRHGEYIDEKESSSTSQSHFSLVSERLSKSSISSEKEDLLPVTFDDRTVNLINSTISGTSDYRNHVLDRNANHEALESSSRKGINVGSDIKAWLPPSSVGSGSVEEQFEKNVCINTVSDKTFGYGDSKTIQPLQLPDTTKNTETVEESDTENDKEFGGFRNKAYKRPPYFKNTSNENSSSLGDISAQNERSFPTVRTTSINSDTHIQDKYTREASRGNRTEGMRNISSDSKSYDVVSNSQETLTSTHDSRIPKEQSEVKNKLGSRSSTTYFHSENSDSEDELAKQNSASLTRPDNGISRRTSAPSKTDTDLSSNNVPSYKTYGTRPGWNSLRDYVSNNRKASYTMKSSENRGSSEPRSAEHATPKPISIPNRSPPATRMQPSSSLPKTVIQDNEDKKDGSKSLNSNGETTPSMQKLDHVHPKLPDYDSFVAHLMSFKKDRQ
ncbi:hypothetical protein TanjilG_30260 [Lupinus angustifolius]|uniref:IST1-like protein n=1 Tax=Lupinus angustifolius TaxID=3871 RepID=A0A4P1R716_LUPAN|nr:hypothetical protein TanjilG_30260 [Lupinus angustifolius]